jgi:hypothetical protein
MLRKTLFVAFFAGAALVGCDKPNYGVQIAGTAHSQDRTSELRDVCMGRGLAPGTSTYSNCLQLEADRRQPNGSYASHFNRPGMRYDERGQLVDSAGYLIDRDGRRIGGKGHWIAGARDDVLPPGTHVDSAGRALAAPGTPPANAISIPNDTVVPSRAERRRGVTNCVGFTDANGEQSSCAVTRQLSQREAQAQRRTAEARFEAQVRDSCAAYGLQAGTPVYNECLAREAQGGR